ncbi:hypothetical protein HWV62_23665 [Athelia sp. TMB]|nr:hypothetical protein HWV62_23665 [Athelia sp. TMB]
MAEQPRYTPSDMDIYQRRSDFFTLWLHDLLGRDETSLDVKRKAVSEVIIYTSRINMRFQNEIELRDWLEPLWNSWIAGQAENPPRPLTEAELAIESGKPVGIDPLALPAPLDDAFPELLITPTLEGLLDTYPPSSHRTAKLSEDVNMNDPDDFDFTEDDIDGTAPKVPEKAKRSRVKHTAPSTRSPYLTRSATVPVGTRRLQKENEESSSGQHVEHKDSATPGKLGGSQPAGEKAPLKAGKMRSTNKGKPTQRALALLKSILNDPGFKYTSFVRPFVFPPDRAHVDPGDRLLQIAEHAIYAQSGIKLASLPHLMRRSMGKASDGRAVGSAILERPHARFTKKKRKGRNPKSGTSSRATENMRYDSNDPEDSGNNDDGPDAGELQGDEGFASLRPITKPQMIKMLDDFRADFSKHEALLQALVSENHRETLASFNPRLDRLDSRHASLHVKHVTLGRQMEDLRADNIALRKLLEKQMDDLRPGLDALTRLISVGGLKPGAEGLS